MPKVMGRAMKLMKLTRTPPAASAPRSQASPTPSVARTAAAGRDRRNSKITASAVAPSDSSTARGMSTSVARSRSAKITAPGAAHDGAARQARLPERLGPGEQVAQVRIAAPGRRLYIDDAAL